MKHQKTLKQLLDEGTTLIPMEQNPFDANTAYCIGFYYEGCRYNAFDDRFKTSDQCQSAINKLMVEYFKTIHQDWKIPALPN